MSELVFDEASHSYHLDGERLPSVTGIINAIFPMRNVDEYYLQRGTATHRACELLDNCSLDWDTVDPAILPRVKAWEAFRRDTPWLNLVAVEEPLAHSGLRFAGTVDRIFSDGKKLLVCDIKNSYSPQVKLQLAFYSLLWAHNKHQQPVYSVTVELCADGDYKCYWSTERELRIAERQALAVLTVFNFARESSLLEKKS